MWNLAVEVIETIEWIISRWSFHMVMFLKNKRRAGFWGGLYIGERLDWIDGMR